MAIEGNMEYASARVHAQHGRRPDEGDWRRLESSRDLAHYLDTARSSVPSTWVCAWVASITPDQDPHAIERSLRANWRAHVDLVASWHPHDAQAWLRWLGWLPSLSLLAQLARPEPAPRWLLADPVCGPLAPGTPDERSTRLGGTPLAPLRSAVASGVPIATLWRQHWDALEPNSDPDVRDLMKALQQAVDEQAGALAAGETHGAASGILRRNWADRLARLFRLSAGSIVATVCYLGLLAVDLERLRGGLVSRCIFAPTAGETA